MVNLANNIETVQNHVRYSPDKSHKVRLGFISIFYFWGLTSFRLQRNSVSLCISKTVCYYAKMRKCTLHNSPGTRFYSTVQVLQLLKMGVVAKY